MLKQRGFYVDVTPGGEPVTPQETTDAEAVREVIAHVHQVGWQLRLGEHIEGKGRMQREHDVPPASKEVIERMRDLLRRVDPEMADRVAESMRQGTKARSSTTPLTRSSCRRTPSRPLAALATKPRTASYGR